jgi:predicted kinase
MSRKILIMGLPGAGKTTLAGELAPLINAAMFNADEVRANINKDLGFERIDLDASTEAISATAIRDQIGGAGR